jgi:hypothetical protein
MAARSPGLRDSHIRCRQGTAPPQLLHEGHRSVEREYGGSRENCQEATTQGKAAVDRDDASAIGWLQKASAVGSVAAYLWLGDMHRDGLGVAPDYVMACTIYGRVQGGRSQAHHFNNRLSAPREQNRCANRNGMHAAHCPCDTADDCSRSPNNRIRATALVTC